MVNYSLNLPDVETRLYPDGIESLLMEETPALGIFSKKNCLFEQGRELNWQISGSGGSATTLSEAESNESPSIHKRPFITRTKEYSSAILEREAYIATQGDKDAIVDLVRLVTENGIRGIKRSWSTQMYRDGTGVRAQLAATNSGVGTTTITLANANDVKLFEAQDWVQATGDKVNLASAGAKIQITGRNIGAGQLIAAGNWTSSIANITDGYYLLRSGDLNNVVKGLSAWIPVNSPQNGENFFGIDRSALGEAAFGHRPSITSSNLLSIGIDAMAYLHDVTGGSPDIWLLNAMDYGAICKDATGIETIFLDAKGSNGKTIADIGYSAVRINGARGKIDVVIDPLLPRGKSYMGNREVCEWWTAGSLVERITFGMGNNEGFAVRGVDGLVLRYAGMGQFVCKEPFRWAYVALPTG